MGKRHVVYQFYCVSAKNAVGDECVNLNKQKGDYELRKKGRRRGGGEEGRKDRESEGPQKHTSDAP